MYHESENHEKIHNGLCARIRRITWGTLQANLLGHFFERCDVKRLAVVAQPVSADSIEDDV